MLRFDQFDMIILNIFYVVLIQMINWLNKIKTVMNELFQENCVSVEQKWSVIVKK